MTKLENKFITDRAIAGAAGAALTAGIYVALTGGNASEMLRSVVAAGAAGAVAGAVMGGIELKKLEKAGFDFEEFEAIGELFK